MFLIGPYQDYPDALKELSADDWNGRPEICPDSYGGFKLQPNTKAS